MNEVLSWNRKITKSQLWLKQSSQYCLTALYRPNLLALLLSPTWKKSCCGTAYTIWQVFSLLISISNLMLNVVYFQTCSEYYFYHNKSGESMLASFKIIVLLKGFVQSGHGRSGENLEEWRSSTAMLLTRSLMTWSVCLTSRLAAECFCRSLPVEFLHPYAFNSSRPLSQFKSKEVWKSGKREEGLLLLLREK